MDAGAIVVVGGTSGIGLRLAETYAARGREVVITGRELERCSTAAISMENGAVNGVNLDVDGGWILA